MRSETGMGWGIPLGIAAAIVLIAGLFFFTSNSDRTTTASNKTPAATTQTNPSGQDRTSPAPTPPAKTQ
jgi:hypothetical protein